MITLREKHVQSIYQSVLAIDPMPALVDRSVVNAWSVEDSDVVVVHRGKELPDENMIGVTDRLCEVLISIVTRHPIPEQRADELMEKIHPVIMQYTADGVTDMSEGETDAPKFADPDGRVCMITAHYRLIYRTTGNSLTE